MKLLIRTPYSQHLEKLRLQTVENGLKPVPAGASNDSTSGKVELTQPSGIRNKPVSNLGSETIDFHSVQQDYQRIISTFDSLIRTLVAAKEDLNQMVAPEFAGRGVLENRRRAMLVQEQESELADIKHDLKELQRRRSSFEDLFSDQINGEIKNLDKATLRTLKTEMLSFENSMKMAKRKVDAQLGVNQDFRSRFLEWQGNQIAISPLGEQGHIRKP